MRILVSWNCGAYVSSIHPNFQSALEDMVAQFGTPDKVEFVGEDE
jgi:hypothetical protein